MEGNTGTPPESVNRGKWENFDEENGEINGHCQEISVPKKLLLEQNHLSENCELINDPKALRKQGNSSLNGENEVTGTEPRENLEEKSKHSETSPRKINTLQQFDLEPRVDSSNLLETTTDQATDNALGVRESPSKSNTGELSAEQNFIQSNDLSERKADGVGGELNGESDFSGSAVDQGLAGEKNIPSAKWTTFEKGVDKGSSTDEACNRTEDSSIAKKQNINTPTTNPNMAAFDSQAALTTNIISNLSTVTEPSAVQPNSVSINQGKIGTNLPSNSHSPTASSMKSAVPIVNQTSTIDKSALRSTTSNSQQPQVGIISATKQNKDEVGTKWVSFGEEGNSNAVSNVSQQKADLGGNLGNLETSKRLVGSDLQKLDLAVNNTKQTTNTAGLQAEKVLNGKALSETTSVMAPVSFTSAELDLLASKSWIQFDDSSTEKHVQSQADSRAATSSVQQSWVTFGDSSAPVGQNLDLLELDVSGKTKFSGTTSSPNPFTTATPPSGSNPFKPPAAPSPTNPFQADTTALNSAIPFPALNQGPISSSTPLTETKTLLVTDPTAQLTITHQGPPVDNLKSANKPELAVTQDQVDARPVKPVSQDRQSAQVNEEPLLEEKSLTTSGSWSMLLRFPDKKRKIGSREWKPVVIKLEGTTLQIFEEYELSAPFREIPLQAYFVFTAPKLQSFEHGAKVHTVKLEYVKYTEGRSLRHRGTVEHTAQGTTIIKIASPSHVVIRELLESFNNSLRLLPAYRDRGITYRHDEVFVDVEDLTNVLLSGDGTILRKNAKVLIKFRGFLTGDPECQLVLNDIVLREREEARLRGEEKPQRVHHWVKLRRCDFHKCVNITTFDQSHAITFHPLDACTFELMRFPVDHQKPLPLQVKAVLNVHSEQRIELKAEIQVCQETKMAKYLRNNVVFRFPIPETWVPLFRTSKAFRGEKSIKSSTGRRAAAIKSRLRNSKCSIAVSLGKAKYEPEYGAVVWHIDQLPFIHSKIPADAPQTLTCILDLPPGMEYPENYKPTAELEYDVAYVLVSDTTVIAVKVSNQNIPDKWVCYRALYHYDVNIDISRPTSGPVRDVGCTQQ